MRETEELLELCRYAASSLAISQGAGGNASVKRPSDGSMWIKSSGYRLSAVRDGQGYLRMLTPSVTGLAGSVAGRDEDSANLSMSAYMQELVLDSTNQKPSLETWFHAVLGRVVLHTHPIYANAFSCMEGGREELDKLLAESATHVGYRTPGHLLGDAVHAAAQTHRQIRRATPAQVLLENHGLITVADTVTEAIERSEEVLKAGRDYFGPLDDACFGEAEPHPELEAWGCRLEKACRAGADEQPLVRAARFGFLRGTQTNRYEMPDPLVPDDVICNGPSVLCARADEPVEEFVKRNSGALSHASAIRVRDLGFVFAARTAPMIEAMEEQLLANLLVRQLIRRRGQCRRLPVSEARSLLSMESEKHRQAVIGGGGQLCRS